MTPPTKSVRIIVEERDVVNLCGLCIVLGILLGAAATGGWG